MHQFLVFIVCGQYFALNVQCINEIFVPNKIQKICLAPPEIFGMLNLRGRIITLVNMPRLLEFPLLPLDEPKNWHRCIGVSHGGVQYGLLVSSIEDVLDLETDGLMKLPRSVGSSLQHAAYGIYPAEDRLLIPLKLPELFENLRHASELGERTL